MNQSLEELSDAAANALAALTTRRTFEEARAALNEAGMHAARRRLDEALAAIEKRQTMLREQRAVVQQTADNLDQALADAEWELDARFVHEGNKWFLVDGDERRQMTADERRDWKAREAAKNPDVDVKRGAHRQAQFDLDACKDAVDFAELAFRAARADLDAAIASVETLTTGIRKENER